MRFSKRQYGRTAERRGEREMRAMTIAHDEMQEFKNGRFENSSGKSGRQHSRKKVTEGLRTSEV
jgi:hypothetical protein